jgi:hypothetical protein
MFAWWVLKRLTARAVSQSASRNSVAAKERKKELIMKAGSQEKNSSWFPSFLIS